MEEFKSLENLFEKDHLHVLTDAVSGNTNFNLENLHYTLSCETLNDSVPDEIKGQFNIAKNMALYSFFCYGLVAGVHLKTYIVIEYALRIKYEKSHPNKKAPALKNLIDLAVKEKLISDVGFRHLKNPSKENTWCNELSKVITYLRNSQAHGSDTSTPDCLTNIRVCADFINQLFP